MIPRLQRDLAASVQEVRNLLEVCGGAAAGRHGLGISARAVMACWKPRHILSVGP